MVFIIGWLIARPYIGLRHDGVLYFGQLLHRLHPERLGSDPFFRFGSQDSFSLFSRIAMWATDAFGIFTAAPLLLVFTQTAVAVAIVLYALRLLDRRYAWYGAIFVAVMPSWYGGWTIFSYTETFLTARSVAEPVILLAMTLLLANRRWWSLALLVLAALLHPLMALPALAVWWLACSLQDKRFYWLALLGLVPLALGLLGQAPFDKLFVTYDPDWAAVVREVNGFIIPSEWQITDWCTIAVDYLVLLTARRAAPLHYRRLLDALMVIGAGSVLIGEAGFTMLHNVLLTSLQVWRSLWLVHLTALLYLPVLLILAFKRQDDCGRLMAPLWIVATLAGNTYAGPITAAAGFLLTLRGEGVCPNIATPLVRKALWLGAAGVLIAIIGRWVPPPMLTEHILDETSHDYFRFVRTSATAFPMPLLGTLLFFPLAFVSARKKWPLAVLLLVMVGLATTVDQRTPWHQFVEHQDADSHPFLKFIGPNQDIYWDGELMVPWLLLQRPSYYLSQQASGSLFNRDTAMTLSHRKKLLKYVDFQLSICGIQSMLEWKTNTEQRTSCVPTEDVLRDLCQTDDPPDFMVFDNTLQIPPLSVWKTAVSKGHELKTYYLYSCQQLRDAPVNTVQ